MVSTRDFLLEIGTEEIPARCLEQLATTLAQDIEKGFVKAGIEFDTSKQYLPLDKSVEVFWTYRRLAVRLTGVKESQRDREDVLTGPPLAMAKNDKGEWLPSALGFAKKAGIDVVNLDTCIGKDAKGRDVLSYTKLVKGGDTKTVLSTLIPQILQDLALPVAMRWGDQDKTFYRPVQWIVCLFGEEVVPFSFFEGVSGNVSRGHRFLTQNEEGSILGSKCLIATPKMYEQVLEEAFVLVCPLTRRIKILEALGSPNEEEEKLLDEVINLVEFPTPLVGAFDSKYLEIPSEVLAKTMMSHQRYFPIYSEGKITNQFIVVAENVRDTNRATIIAGNERVLVARLEDARFFFNEDKKKPLVEYIEGLKNVTFQKGMGSLFDKKERVKRLAKHIAGLVGYLYEKQLDRVCDLCKADLVTHMVYEFPELQGIMGSYYGLLNQESSDVCTAIREHYYPLSSSSDVSSSILASIVGLADRVDTIVVTYQNGLIPTGSKDPLGIRRAMISLLKVEAVHGFSLDFIALFKKGYEVLGKGEGNLDQLLAFFTQRVQTFIEESGASYDIAQSLTDVGLTRLNDAVAMAKILFEYKHSDPNFKRLVETAVRVKRLAKHAEHACVEETLLKEDSEKKMFVLFSKLNDVVSLGDLHGLVEPLNRYFEDVMVMAEDVQLKQNRLAFLSNVNRVFLSVADFEKIIIGS